MRPGSLNPSCHLMSGKTGICCATGQQHSVETKVTPRDAATASEDIKITHDVSKKKLVQWLANEKVLERSGDTTVSPSAPEYGHHLSMVTYDKRVESLGRGALLNLFATQELKARQAVSDDELELGVTGHTDGPFCPKPPNCPETRNRYRTIGGECNNIGNPTWGAVNTGFERLLPPDYSDGIWSMRVSTSGKPLPSPRLISSVLLPEGNHPSPTHNLMFMQFGQFIAHDTSAGVMFSFGNGTAISCCSGGVHQLPPDLQHWACAPITAAPDDPFYGFFRQSCLNFVRAQLAPSSDCTVGYAKQMNGATHYPDLSHLYGTTPEKLSLIRDKGGKLKTFNDFGRDLPPLTRRKECLNFNDAAPCFESGDNHGNQLISLTAFHTIWTREHNRVAGVLAQLNPRWDEETIFMETRRIVQAEFQHIIYNEWLPLLIGPQMMQLFGLSPSSEYSSSYDPKVNPSLTAEFASAAMRFGHSMVDGRIVIPNTMTGEVYETISIPEVMFQPSRMRLRHFLDRLLIGLTLQPMQTVDPFISEGLTSYMFRGTNAYGLDLASINIQRGRDYGVRSYNNYRRLCGLAPFDNFEQFPISAAKRLASVYETPEDIDLWVGGLLEAPIQGGIIGPTFAHIIADQFARLKTGDRYFYENGPDVNPGAFTPSQLSEIKKVKLSRLICDNSDGIELISQPPEAFIRADLPGNEPVPCNSGRLPSMDLTRFKTP